MYKYSNIVVEKDKVKKTYLCSVDKVRCCY